ncbi:SRPBCC family protein [Nonomuraea antimicrobica]
MSSFRRQIGRSAALLPLPLVMAGTLAVAAPSSATTHQAPNATTSPTPNTAASDQARNATAESHSQAPLTCGGQGVDPAAKIRYRAETLIKAPPHTIWKLQTDVERWPSWQPPVTGMKRLDPGRLRPGSRFQWTTPVPETPTTPATTLVITSTVQQIKNNRCIRWTGPAIGEGLRIDRGVHVWTFTKVKEACWCVPRRPGPATRWRPTYPPPPPT